jgi:hypothetical protein
MRLGVQHAGVEMRARRAATTERVQVLLDYAASIAASLHSRPEIHVRVRRIGGIRLGAEVIGMAIGVVYVLYARPVAPCGAANDAHTAGRHSASYRA